MPVHFVFDPIMRRIALAKQNANDFKAAFGGMLDTPLWEEFHRLADVVLCSDMPNTSGLTSLQMRGGNGGMTDNNRRPQHPICQDTNQ